MSKKNHSESIFSVVKNFGWILKRVIKYSPGLILDKIIRIPISVLSSYISINLSRWILDRVQSDMELNSIIFFVIFIFSFFIITNLIFAVLSIFWVPQRQIDFGYRMREEVFNKINKIDQINFQNTKFFDSYTLALNEVDMRAIYVLECITNIFASLISFLVITDVTGSINVDFALYGCIATLIDVVLGTYRQKLNYKQTLEATPDERKRGYIVRITYQPEFSADLKIYPKFIQLLLFHYKKATQSVKAIIFKFAKKIIFIDQGQQIPGLIFRQIVPWIIIVILLKNGEITIAESTVLVSASLTIPNTLTSFVSGIGSAYAHSFYINNLKKLLTYEENIECDKGEIIDEDVSLDISVKNIYFSYDKKNNIINDVSFNIHPGEKISIVGHNGAGKSTLVKLLIRMYDVDDGEIMINGKGINEYNIHSLRSRIAFMGQDFKIYSFSIAENILMHPVTSEADVELVHEALKKVGLFEKVISFENGIDTFITREFEESGQYFSGGELQKLALARIYAGNYDCIILDESTSSLDPISEDDIINTIFQIFNDKTVIMISHRLATIKYTDLVYFLENGRIIEYGSHQQLMDTQGEYSKFYLTQASKYDVGV